MIQLLFKLLCGHALADFALQGEFIAIYKSRHARFFTGETIWPYVLGAHGLIHGLMVFIATGSIYVSLAETVCHCAIDFCKCEKRFGFHVDQLLHVVCKVLWVVVVLHR